jgi:hypothetical protein
MPAFSLPWAPPLAYATASLPRERSPTTPRKYRDIHGFGGKLKPRYILGTGSLDQ